MIIDQDRIKLVALGETNYDVVVAAVTFTITKPMENKDLYFVKWESGWGHILMQTKTKIVNELSD